ncbi:MAG: phage portal protein [Clostridiales bacterium]|nr:phage portal protein [Clostridiales bacterium]
MAIFDFLKRKEKRAFYPTTTSVRPALVFPAEKNPTVASCIDKISKTLSSISLELYENTKNGMKIAKSHPLHFALEDPSYEETPSLFFRTMYSFMYYTGNAYLLKMRNSKDEIIGFRLVDPKWVTTVKRDENGRKMFFIADQWHSDHSILHIPLPGEGYNGTLGASPITVHREIIELDNTLLAYVSNYFDNSVGSRLAIELGQSYPYRKDNMDKLYAEIMPVLNKFVLGAQNAGKPMIGFPDSTLKELSQTSNVQAELKSLMKMVEHQIAQTLFSVPFEVLDSEASKYDSLETKQNDFLASCIKPLGDHICESFEKLLSPADRLKYSVRFDYKNLLTTNTKDTVDYLAKEINNGLLTINEARKKLGMEDIGEVGDVHFIPSNQMPLTEENVKAYMAKNKTAMGHNPQGDDKS